MLPQRIIRLPHIVVMPAATVSSVPTDGVRPTWTISFNMHQLVLRCICITLVLHGIGLATTKALGPTPAQVLPLHLFPPPLPPPVPRPLPPTPALLSPPTVTALAPRRSLELDRLRASHLSMAVPIYLPAAHAARHSPACGLSHSLRRPHPRHPHHRRSLQLFRRCPQMGLYYYSSAFALVAYAIAVTLIVRVTAPAGTDHSVRCGAVANNAFLVAACAGPPLLLLFLVSTAPGVRIALACLAAACALSLPVCCCWSCWAAAAAPGDQQSQFLASSPGLLSGTQVCVCLCVFHRRCCSYRRLIAWLCLLSLDRSRCVYCAADKSALQRPARRTCWLISQCHAAGPETADGSLLQPLLSSPMEPPKVTSCAYAVPVVVCLTRRSAPAGIVHVTLQSVLFQHTSASQCRPSHQ